MLLSRVADALYWISRYLERAEHTARVIDVAADVSLGRPAGSAVLERLYTSLGPTPVEPSNPVRLLDAALLDVSNRNSVVSCLVAARENARQVREEISSQMWEQINALYLRMRDLREDAAVTARTHYVSRTIVEGVHLFQGITDATMSHGEGWQYLQAGRFLERAEATARVLDAFLSDDGDGLVPPAHDQADWVALMRACAALEGYCRHYTADVQPERVTDFLLLNADFPRSIRFAAARIEGALRGLGRAAGRPASARAERLAGRLRASLDYGQVDEILQEGPHAYLTGVARQCAQIHAALYQGYISYPIESALPA